MAEQFRLVNYYNLPRYIYINYYKLVISHDIPIISSINPSEDVHPGRFLGGVGAQLDPADFPGLDGIWGSSSWNLAARVISPLPWHIRIYWWCQDLVFWLHRQRGYCCVYHISTCLFAWIPWDILVRNMTTYYLLTTLINSCWLATTPSTFFLAVRGH